ncbi:MAG TPA: nucleoside triphosphate pyrophosphohydrolase [Candidatus Obscuribacterales bacterium]
MTTHIDEFIHTIARLRAEDGCPWDREQTHRSLARYLLEEAYEVLEAIHSGSPAKLKEELGDLLLQVVLNAQIAKDEGNFDIQDVADGINKKMINRHPHVFGESSLESSRAVLAKWDELKDEERKDKKDTDGSALDGISRTLPSLLQALKISEKAVSQGFEWRNEGEVWEKLHSEMQELEEAISNPALNQPQTAASARYDVEMELGDVLFTLVNVARWHALNPEESLLLALDKFRRRFAKMEKLSQKPLKELSKDHLEELWQEAKKATK